MRLRVIYIVLMMAIISGCKQQQPLIVTPANVHNIESNHNSTDSKQDTVYIDKIRTIQLKGDTIYIHDSIFIKEWHKRFVHDTISISTTDTIHPEPIVIEKETKRTGIDNFLRWSGGALWAIILLIVIVIIARIFIR